MSEIKREKSIVDFSFPDFKAGQFPLSKGEDLTISFLVFDAVNYEDIEDRLVDCLTVISKGYVAPEEETVPSSMAVLIGKEIAKYDLNKPIDNNRVCTLQVYGLDRLYIMLYPEQGKTSDELLDQLLRNYDINTQVILFRIEKLEENQYLYTGELYA